MMKVFESVKYSYDTKQAQDEHLNYMEQYGYIVVESYTAQNGYYYTIFERKL